MVPIVVHEEHHEALVAWRAAWKKRPTELLINVDSHSDLGQPSTKSAFDYRHSTSEEFLEYVLDNFNINNFVLAAGFYGFFKNLVWLQPRNSKKGKSSNEKFTIELINHQSDGLRIQSIVRQQSYREDFSASPRNPNTILSLFTLCEARIPREFLRKSCILSIDLDFFSCNIEPMPIPTRVEITENEFLRFYTETTALRLLDGARLKAVEVDGLFYLESSSIAPVLNPTRVSADEIERRIASLVSTLQTSKLTPALITVCRSVFSGFTPIDQSSFIEEKLLKALSSIYQTRATTLTDVKWD